MLLAIWTSYQKEVDEKSSKNKNIRIQLIEGLRSLPMAVGSTLFQIDKSCKAIAKVIGYNHSVICLGKGPSSAIAKEGALKLKELTYIHAEAFSAGELKHGPLALINAENPKTTAIVLIILDDEFFHEMNLALSEVESRGALTIVITDCLSKLNKSKIDYAVEIPNIGLMTPILSVLPFQKITSEICVLLERNPDKPRNLAKCVTVK